MKQPRILTSSIAAQAIPAKVSSPTKFWALSLGLAIAGLSAAHAVNSELDVVNGQTDLSLAATYGGTAPTTTSDVTFTNQVYSPAAFALSTDLSIGTLNDLSPTALTIANSSGAARLITLNGGGDTVAGSAASDLLYVATGGSLTLTGGTGVTALGLVLATSGNFDIAGTGAATISSIISGANSLTKTGTGTLTLSGVNTYNQGTNVNGGILQLTQTAGAAALGTVNLGGGNFQINVGTSNFGYNPTINVTAAGSTFSSVGAGQINYTGALTGNNNALNIATGTSRLYVNGAVTGVTQFNVTAGAMGLDLSANLNQGTAVNVSSGASLYFANTQNALSSNITLNGGTGQGAVGAIFFESATTTLQTAILSGTLTLASTSTIGNNNTLANTNVILRGKVTGSGGFTKTGASTLTLANPTNDYTGTTTISAGTLQITNGATIATSSDIVDNGTLIYNQFNSQTYGNIISGSGGLTKTGSGTWTLSGANSYAGATLVSGGILKVGNGTVGSLGSGNALTFGGTSTINFNEGAGSAQSMGALTFNAIEGTVQSTYGGSGNTSLIFSNVIVRPAGGTGNFVTTNGSNGSTNKIVLTQFVGATTPTGALLDKGYYYNGADFAAYDATGYVRALAYGSDTSAATVDTITASNHVKLTLSPAAHAGDTLLTLNLAAGGVDYAMTSGTLTLSGGGLIKSGGGALSTISGGANVTSTGAVELVIRTDTSSDLLNISTPITGSTGGLTKSGAGTLTLSAVANSYTGATTVDNGTLTLSAAGTYTGGSAFTVRGGGTLNINGASNGNIVVNATTGNFATANVSAAITLANTNTITVGSTFGGTAILNVATGTNISGGNSAISVGVNGLGVLNMTGGAIAPGQFLVAGITNAGAVGIWNISGGAVTTTANNGGTVGATALTTGQVNITGTGSYVSTGTGNVAAGIYVGEAGVGTLNISGGGSATLGGGIALSAGLNLGRNNVNTALGIANLGAIGGGTVNNGLITTNVVQKTGGAATGIFNFHGGTLKAAATNVTAAFMTGLSSAYVYGEGGVVDNNAQTITIGQALLAPTGSGVSSISVTGGTNYATAPYVAISGGGGTGATAVANIDVNGNITSVTMTNPGVGYTSAPTVNLIGGNGNFTSAVPTTTANSSGGLTFAGTGGTTTLTGASSYTGGTTVNGGTLNLSRATNDGTGTIRGTLTVNTGAVVNATTANAIGYLSGAGVSTANVNGGTLNTSAVGDQGFNTSYNLTGGTLTSNGGVSSPTATSYWVLGRISAGGTDTDAVNSLASATTSTIAGRLQLRNDNANNNVTFTVADGGAPTDLNVTAAITEGGSVGIIKAGSGAMALTGTNSYSGGTVVSLGELSVSASGTLGTGNVAVNTGALNADSHLTLQTGVIDAISNTAVLSLAGGGVPLTADTGFALLQNASETVGGLVLGGVLQVAGTYGATGSGATFTNNEYFSGAGVINNLAVTIPEPGTVASLFGGLGMLLGLQRRRSRAMKG